MKQIMPLKRAVVELTHEAESGDENGIRRAVKAWQNRAYNGSIPRALLRKLGKGLFVDLEIWQEMLSEKNKRNHDVGGGRPRTDSR